MFVRWKRRKLRREDQPVFVDSESGEEVEPGRYGWPGYDVLGGSSADTRRTYVRNIGWTKSVRKAGMDPADVRTKPAPDVFTLDAVLVESVRIEGKPRQRHIAHLATIREADLATGADPCWRVQFWRKISRRLDDLEIEGADRVRVLDAVAQRVPRPTADDAEREIARAADEARLIRSLTA